MLVDWAFLFVFLPLSLHIGTQGAMEDEVVAHVYRFLFDRFVAEHPGHNIPQDGALVRHIVLISVGVFVSLLVVVAILDTPVAVVMLPYPVFFTVTERVSVYFL